MLVRARSRQKAEQVENEGEIDPDRFFSYLLVVVDPTWFDNRNQVLLLRLPDCLAPDRPMARVGLYKVSTNLAIIHILPSLCRSETELNHDRVKLLLEVPQHQVLIVLLALLSLSLLSLFFFLLLCLSLEVSYPGLRQQVARVELGLGRLTCLDPAEGRRHCRCIWRLLA